MKMTKLIGPGLAAGFLLLGLAACQDFEKGDVVEARVGRIMGDPCLVSIELKANADRYRRALVARLETPECKAPVGPVAPQSR